MSEEKMSEIKMLCADEVIPVDTRILSLFAFITSTIDF